MNVTVKVGWGRGGGFFDGQGGVEKCSSAAERTEKMGEKKNTTKKKHTIFY